MVVTNQIYNKYASHLDWHISLHADYPMLHSQWWLTTGRVVNGQFVTPGSRLSNALDFLVLGANPWAKVHQNRS